MWDKKIRTMGSGSDFTAFQDFAGIPSLDMGFGGAGPDTPVYHYHSNYDSKAWMDKFGDPTFAYHSAMAKVWAVLAARLVETPVVQLNATEYATNLKRYIAALEKKSAESNWFATHKHTRDIFGELEAAVSRFRFAAAIHDGLAASLLDQLYRNDIPWWKFWEKLKLFYAVRRVNTKYKLLERKFLYEQGLDGRPWFKHVVFAPGKWTGYAGATFPGIVEGIEEEDLGVVYRWVNIAVEVLEGAAEFLEED